MIFIHLLYSIVLYYHIQVYLNNCMQSFVIYIYTLNKWYIRVLSEEFSKQISTLYFWHLSMTSSSVNFKPPD